MEYGYAVRDVYLGAGAATVVGSGVVLRAGAALYAGVTVGDDTTIGHHTLLRTNVKVGSGSQLAANLTVERGSTIGDGVRCSPGSHITADTVIADRVFLGAGVRTINDKELIWRDPEQERPLSPPSFGYGCKVGSGAVILAGVTIGEQALVGGRVGGHPRRAGPAVWGGGAVSKALAWLEPLRSSVPELDGPAWRDLARFADDLERMCRGAPAPAPPTWSQWLLALRRDLAALGHRVPPGPSGAMWQTLAQFVAGFHDLDDLTGLLYADGVHDSLYRSGGQILLTPAPLAAIVPIRPERVAERQRDEAA